MHSTTSAKHSPNSPSDSEDELAHALTQQIDPNQTPRTKSLLRIINTRDVSQIKLLKGVGAKRAEALVNCLCDLDLGMEEDGEQHHRVQSLVELRRLRGMGGKMVESMRNGL